MPPGQYLYTVEYSLIFKDEYDNPQSSECYTEGIYLTKADANSAAALCRDEHADDDDLDADEFVEMKDEHGLNEYEYTDWDDDLERTRTVTISVERRTVRSLDVEGTIEAMREIEMKKFRESAEGGSLKTELKEQLLQESRADTELTAELG